MVQKSEYLRESGEAPYSDMSCAVVSLASTSHVVRSNCTLMDHFPMTSHIHRSLIITPRIMPGGQHALSNVLRSMGKTQLAHAFLHVNSA